MTSNEILGLWLTGRLSLVGTNWSAAIRNVLLVALAGGLIAVALEPDHTSGLPFLTALGLWSSHIAIALLLFVGSLSVLQRLGLPDPLPPILGMLVLPLIFAPASLLLDLGFGKPDEELASAASPMSVYLSEVVAVAPMSFAAALVMSFILYKKAVSCRALDEASKVGAAPSVPALRDLIRDIPHSLGDDIVRLQAQDHYVEVVTTEGRALVLERFSDCVDKLKPFSGLQCHRSHWVSLHHVDGVMPSGSAYLCSLSNGDQVPVSRRRCSELKRRLGRRAPLRESGNYR